MEALLVDQIPEGEQWQYEPKWDGFRCLAFRDGSKIELQSKSGNSLTRYFPELVAALSKIRPRRFVLDGEIAVPVERRFSFDDLLQRIHPAASRVKKLAREHPGLFIAFDLLVDNEGRPLLNLPLRERRKMLEEFARAFTVAPDRLRLSPATNNLAVAKRWFDRVGNDLDGIIAKRSDVEYRPGDRTAMRKIKLMRTADCVIGGFRYAAKQRVVGSLLLGLYDDQGLLNHVGFCSGLKAHERKSLLKKLVPLIEPPGFTGRAPGGPSRWSMRRTDEWQPLKPKLIIEVSYDHFTGGRFRHGTTLVCWRPDKNPKQCTLDQVAPVGLGSLRLLEKDLVE
jgi:ATP-dependent DNA ligase